MTQTPLQTIQAQFDHKVGEARTQLAQAEADFNALKAAIAEDERKVGFLAASLAAIESRIGGNNTPSISTTSIAEIEIKPAGSGHDIGTEYAGQPPNGSRPEITIEGVLSDLSRIRAGLDHAAVVPAKIIPPNQAQNLSNSSVLDASARSRTRPVKLSRPKATDITMSIDISPENLAKLREAAETFNNILLLTSVCGMSYAKQRGDLVEYRKALDGILYRFIFSAGSPDAARREELKMLQGCGDPVNFPAANLTATEKSAMEQIDRAFSIADQTERENTLSGMLNLMYGKCIDASKSLVTYCAEHQTAPDNGKLSGIQNRLDAYFRLLCVLLKRTADYMETNNAPNRLLKAVAGNGNGKFHPEYDLPNDYRIDGLPNLVIQMGDRIAAVTHKLTVLRELLPDDSLSTTSAPREEGDRLAEMIFVENMGMAIHEFHKACALLSNGNGGNLAMKIGSLRRCQFANAFETHRATKAVGYVLETEKEHDDYKKLSEGHTSVRKEYVETLIRKQITPLIEALDDIAHQQDPAQALKNHPMDITRRLGEIGKKLRVLSALNMKWPGKREGYVPAFTAIPDLGPEIIVSVIPASERKPCHDKWDAQYKALRGKTQAFRQILAKSLQAILRNLAQEKSDVPWDTFSSSIIEARQTLAPTIVSFEGCFAMVKAELGLGAQVASQGKSGAVRVDIGTTSGVELDTTEGFGQSYREQFLAGDAQNRALMVCDTLLRIDSDLARIQGEAGLMNGIFYRTCTHGNLAHVMSIFPTRPALLLQHAELAERFLRQMGATRTTPTVRAARERVPANAKA